jgi:hypothetical protein
VHCAGQSSNNNNNNVTKDIKYPLQLAYCRRFWHFPIKDIEVAKFYTRKGCVCVCVCGVGGGLKFPYKVKVG